jgi:four helix bundle protein
MKNFKNLKVWQKGMGLVVTIYKATTQFPKEEIYGLTSQIKRSTVSIPSNIAEGSGHGSDKDFNRFLNIALGSSFELETQLILAKELEFLSEKDFSNISENLDEVQRMITGLQKDLKQSY